MKKAAVRPMSGKAIEEFAEGFRDIFGLKDVLEFPVIKFSEWLLPEIGIDLEVVEDWELPDAYGITDTAKGVIKIRNDVYERACNGVPRDRFTICHEIAHAILHTPDRVEFARGDIPLYMDSEWQANRLAAALLAPRHLAIGMTAKQIEETFGLSTQAAEYRYKDLHKL